MPFGVLRALTNFKPVEVKIDMRMTGNSGGAAGAASESSPFPGAESIFSRRCGGLSGRTSAGAAAGGAAGPGSAGAETLVSPRAAAASPGASKIPGADSTISMGCGEISERGNSQPVA